ncbi:MAG TPA: hypothetical protein VKD90_24045 [Gemmataceae bacterium]|nr:hypothetical protein [Gemmataceae bacterium]
MSKRCPSCGYGPIGPFIDNCPICAEPVRNVRSIGGGRRGSSPPWVYWVGGGALALVLGVAGCCGVTMWRMGRAVDDFQKDLVKQMEQAKAAAEADRQARTVVVTAAQLVDEFQKDAAAADRKYAGKYLEVTGVVERTGRGRHNSPFVVLHGGDENTKFKVECFFDYLADPAVEARFRHLDKGQTVTVRGEYDGQVSNIQLRECVLPK